jgi:uncharacterized protein
VVTSRIAYVETRAAFARARRDKRLSRTEEERSIQALDGQWANLVVVELDEEVMHRAAAIVSALALRASDGIHLASAELVAETEAGPTQFACWDRRLWEAASGRGFTCIPQRI